MAIILTEILGENRAKFKNNSEPSQNLGDTIWTDVTSQGGNTYSLSYSGLDVSGEEIEENVIEVEIEGEINPTKLFWAIVAAAKEVLCPECGTP